MRLKLPISTFLLILCLSKSFGQTKSILFIGNSYTSVNDLPTLVSNIATSMDDALVYDSYTHGGARFMEHAANAAVYSKINSRDWDYVALQAQSQEPSWSQDQVATEVRPYAQQLSDSIKANYHCSLPLFYMTWGRKDGDSQNCNNIPWVCTYEGMDDALAASYTLMAEENEAVVSPVGKVWRHLRENNPGIELYSGDGSHPSLAGSYAAACTFYTMVFQEDPELIPYNSSLSQAEADAIKSAVKLITYDAIDTFHFGNTYPTEPYAAFCENGGSSCDDPLVAVLGTNSTDVTYGAQWFEFIADSTVVVTVSTCSKTDFDTQLSFYDSCDSLVTFSEDACNVQSKIVFNAEKGERYLLKADVFFLETGKQFDFEIYYPKVDSDDIISNTLVNDCSLANTFETGYYLLKSGEEGWGKYVATESGTLTISSCGISDDDTFLTFNTDCVTEVGESDDACSLQSELSLEMDAGDSVLFKWWDEYYYEEFLYEIRFESDNLLTTFNDFDSSNTKVYPNPTTGELSLVGFEKGQNLQVVNLQGQIVLKHQVGENTLNISNLSEGIYFLQQGQINIKIIKK